MVSDSVSRFLGGPPLAVIGKLVLLSILVGVRARGARSRSVEHHPERAEARPLGLGSRLRRGRPALALFPPWGRHRHSGLADRASGQGAAGAAARGLSRSKTKKGW